jgi:hypothetical protein
MINSKNGNLVILHYLSFIAVLSYSYISHLPLCRVQTRRLKFLDHAVACFVVATKIIVGYCWNWLDFDGSFYFHYHFY